MAYLYRQRSTPAPLFNKLPLLARKALLSCALWVTMPLLPVVPPHASRLLGGNHP